MRTRPVPPWPDVALAAAVAVLATVEIALNASIEPKAAAAATQLAAAIALAWRRSLPLAVAAVVSAATAFGALAGVPVEAPVTPLIALVVAAYSVAAHAPLERGLGGLALFAVADAVVVTSQDKGLGNFVFGLVFILGAWAAGHVVRARTARIVDLESERSERERAAAAEERGRIARELHDLIGHSVSVMVVQAGAAEELLQRDPGRALEPVRAVQETGRRTLGEIARLLGVLREHGEELGLGPQPGLEDLRSLVDETRAAGLPVRLRVEGEPRPLDAAVELSAFRIVQEALTNARKHAVDARAEVTLRYLDDAVELEVVDDGRASSNGAGGGHGLVGMRERVALFGGSLEAGPLTPHGFAVRARLPAGDRP